MSGEVQRGVGGAVVKGIFSRTSIPHFVIMKTLLPFLLLAASPLFAQDKNIGVGAEPTENAEVITDGTRGMLDSKWTYWQGPRFGTSLPIKWRIVEDPVDGGTCLMTDDPAAAVGKYGVADIVSGI
jgi:hypothetical protein